MKRGAALPIAVFALALASAVSVGGLYVARQLSTSTHAGQRGAELEPIAESMLVSAVANWDSAARASQEVGRTAPLFSQTSARVRASGWITRISELDYWIVAEAEALDKPLLRRRLGIVLRTHSGLPKLISERAWTQLP